MNKTPFSFLILLVVALLGAQGLHAQKVRTYSNEFLSLGVGARGLAMGGAQAASVGDVTAAYWNPAGLTQVDNIQLAAMHAEWFAGIAKYDYLAAALPIIDDKRAIGISAIRFGVDDIPNTLYLIEPDGSVNYDNLTTFSAADYAFLLSYGQQIKKFNIGGSAKIIYRKVGGFAKAWGFGLDIGARYDISDHFVLGLNLKNITTTVNTWSFNFTEEEKQILEATDNIIPKNSVELTGTRAILGAAYSTTIKSKFGILAELDLDATFDGKRNVLVKSDFMSIDPRFGLELDYDRLVFLRAGVNNFQQYTNDDGKKVTSAQPNFGIGLNIRQIHIDYAFTGLNRASDGLYSHIFSLQIHLNKRDKAENVPVEQ